MITDDNVDLCPGVKQLGEDQRPLMDLVWSKKKPSDIVLEEFKPTEDFDFKQTDNDEYFHFHKTSHVTINGVNYFIGGEKYYSLNDGTSIYDKEFNSGVWQLTYEGLVKTEINNNWSISRAAAAVTDFGNGQGQVAYLCGSVFHPNRCFAFDGVKLEARILLI